MSARACKQKLIMISFIICQFGSNWDLRSLEVSPRLEILISTTFLYSSYLLTWSLAFGWVGAGG